MNFFQNIYYVGILVDAVVAAPKLVLKSFLVSYEGLSNQCIIVMKSLVDQVLKA